MREKGGGRGGRKEKEKTKGRKENGRKGKKKTSDEVWKEGDGW